MIKLKRLLMEQPGFDNVEADASKKNKRVNWKTQEYVLKTSKGETKTVPLEKIFNVFGISAEDNPSFRGPNGHLTRAGQEEIISRSKGTDPQDPIVSITSQASIDAKAKALKTYKDNPVPSAMEKQWTDEDKYNYNINVWDKMKEYSEALQKWWEDVTTENSAANRLFSRKGVQGYYWWNDDDEEKARDLWWKSSTTGQVLYKNLEKLKIKETELLTKLSSSPELRPESQVQKIMNAMDSIYEQITDVFNNDVEWDIQHPIITTEYERYLVDPEIDT